MLDTLAKHKGYRFWPIAEGWASLVDPFCERVFGHQQITDAFLLGLAVKEGGCWLLWDKAIQYLAGTKYAHATVRAPEGKVYDLALE